MDAGALKHCLLALYIELVCFAACGMDSFSNGRTGLKVDELPAHTRFE